MNTKHFFTAIALTIAAASGPVLAQEATYDYPTATTSQTTRAAVLADLALARAEGTLQVNEASEGHAPRFMTQRSRDAVRAEVRHTARNGAPLSTTSETNAFAIEAPQTPAPMTVASK